MAQRRNEADLAPLLDVLAVLSEHGRVADEDARLFLECARRSGQVQECTMLAMDLGSTIYTRDEVLASLATLEAA